MAARTRAADASIRGYLYQFHKTILEILGAGPDDVITAEGPVEDIDRLSPDGTVTATQCKYHGSSSPFSLSDIYKPLLLMMSHCAETGAQTPINYRLFVYAPDKTEGTHELNGKQLETVLATRNQALQKIVEKAKACDLELFLSRLTIEFGASLEQLEESVQQSLKKLDYDDAEIQSVIYPSALHRAAILSSKPNEQDRRTSKASFCGELREVRGTILAWYTNFLKSRREILKAKRRQLRTNLAKNVRHRHILIVADDIDDFDEEIVVFISDFVGKYHSKLELHLETPGFLLACEELQFDEIRQRLYEKGIKVNDGFVGTRFYPDRFRAAPVVRRSKNGESRREFDIRIARYSEDSSLLKEFKADDLYVVQRAPEAPYLRDVNVQLLGVGTFPELKYLLGMTDEYE